MDFNPAFCPAWHIGQIQITVAVAEVADLPLGEQVIEVAHSRKPDRAEKLDRAMPQSFF
ncbi:hypothetical protein D3C75_924500 [compost metagenome]